MRRAASDDHVETGENIAVLKFCERKMLFATQRVGDGDLVVVEIENRDEVAQASETNTDQSREPCGWRESIAKIKLCGEAAAADVSCQIPSLRSARITKGCAGNGMFRRIDTEAPKNSGDAGRTTSRRRTLEADVTAPAFFEDGIRQRCHQRLDVRRHARKQHRK